MLNLTPRLRQFCRLSAQLYNPAESTGGSTQRLPNEHKMVFVVRMDLKMSKGKIAAQCGHAAIANYVKVAQSDPAGLKLWQDNCNAKIALQIHSEQDLRGVEESAKSLGLITTLVVDTGRTQIPADSPTVLGVGPAPKNLIDQVTGHLKLL